LLASGSTGESKAADAPAVDGVFGLSRVTPETYVAAWVAVDGGSVVTGVRWYQNDGLTSFPEVLAMAGNLNWPRTVSAAVPLAQDISGSGSSWNEAVFEQPVTSDSGGLYIVFHLPPGSNFEHVGNGGGFGLGYLAGDGVRRGWVSGNGEDWNPVRPERKMAVEAIVQVNKSAVKPLVLHLGTSGRQGVDAPTRHIAAGMTVFPNPFNARAETRFSLPVAGHANLDVFDLQGRRVIRLLSEDLAAGDHSVIWNGVDESGQTVASGVYYARLQAGDINITRALVLVK
jgi:hypothetical protein